MLVRLVDELHRAAHFFFGEMRGGDEDLVNALAVARLGGTDFHGRWSCGGGHDKRLQKIGERDAGRVQRLAEAAAASDVGVGVDVDDEELACPATAAGRIGT